MKKVLSITMILVFLFSMSMSVYANPKSETEIEPQSAYWEYWEIEDTIKHYDTREVGDWELAFVGQPAKEAGETQTATGSITREIAVTGTVSVGFDDIEVAAGVTIGDAIEKGGYTTSRPLEVGEYIKGYIRSIVDRTKIIQRKYIHMDGQNIKTSTTSTAYVEIPTAVTIDIFYYQSSLKMNSLSESKDAEPKPYKVERYLINGETGEAELIYEEILN